MAKHNENMIGGWAFLIGVVLAIVFALFGVLSPTVSWILIVIGLVVGFLNIADEEATPFLMSGAVLIIASAFGQNAIQVSAILSRVLSALLMIFVPATIVVAIRNTFSLARR